MIANTKLYLLTNKDLNFSTIFHTPDEIMKHIKDTRLDKRNEWIFPYHIIRYKYNPVKKGYSCDGQYRYIHKQKKSCKINYETWLKEDYEKSSLYYDDELFNL